MSEKKICGVSKRHFRRLVARELKKGVGITEQIYIKNLNKNKNCIPSCSKNIVPELDRSNLNNDNIGSISAVEESIPEYKSDGESIPEFKIENISIPECKIESILSPECKIESISIPEYKSDGESISEYISDSSSQFEGMAISNSLYTWAQEHFISEKAVTDLLKILKSPPTICSSCLDLRRELDVIKYKQAEQKILLKKIASKLFINDGENFSSDFDDILPTKTEEDIRNIEDKLKNNEEFKLRFIHYLQNIRGKQHITKIFKQIIYDELADQYNWDGIKGKLEFKKFKIFNDCLFESVKTDISGYQDYIQEIKKALRDAKNRFIKKRFQEKEKL